MGTYKITFTPQEPWFFGNEKGFRFPGQTNGGAYSNSYFIKSEPMPSQSTILGALRYLLIPNKKPIQKYNEDDIKENTECVGSASFDPDKENQTFGKIKKISPVFIVRKGETLIPCPYDHRVKPTKAEAKSEGFNKACVDEEGRFKYYTPFKIYTEIKTANGEKLYTTDFDVKDGVFHGFVSIDGENGNYPVYSLSDVIGTEVRVGNSITSQSDGFFKKQYCSFAPTQEGGKHVKSDACFAVYAELKLDEDNNFDKSFINSKHIVALGQGKSMFVVKIDLVEQDNIGKVVKDFSEKTHTDIEDVKNTFFFCFGDTFVSGDPYENTKFVISDIKNYRYFSRGEYGKVTKGAALKRILKAGSVVIADEWQQTNNNAEQIGYNNIISIIIGGNSNEQETF